VEYDDLDQATNAPNSHGRLISLSIQHISFLSFFVFTHFAPWNHTQHAARDALPCCLNLGLSGVPIPTTSSDHIETVDWAPSPRTLWGALLQQTFYTRWGRYPARLGYVWGRASAQASSITNGHCGGDANLEAASGSRRRGVLCRRARARRLACGVALCDALG
jgi:hypothetical protein